MKKFVVFQALVDEPIKGKENQWSNSWVCNDHDGYTLGINSPHPFAGVICTCQMTKRIQMFICVRSTVWGVDKYVYISCFSSEENKTYYSGKLLINCWKFHWFDGAWKSFQLVPNKWQPIHQTRTWMRTKFVPRKSKWICIRMLRLPQNRWLFLSKKPKQMQCELVFAIDLWIHRLDKCKAKPNIDDSLLEVPFLFQGEFLVLSISQSLKTVVATYQYAKDVLNVLSSHLPNSTIHRILPTCSEAEIFGEILSWFYIDCLKKKWTGAKNNFKVWPQHERNHCLILIRLRCCRHSYIWKEFLSK